ncbi:MAG: MOSC N-terminal beta barrel domain-containing protein [Actinomycetota bacterium]|nr:MOSC N-terminal beta barrel domain-containing protein [Actinomycetota bacterium]
MTSATLTGTLVGLHLHPIKSCHRVEVDRAVIGAHGLEGDRVWQVIGAEGTPLTQRQHAVLAAVQPEALQGGLRVSAPGKGFVDVAPPSVEQSVVAAKTLFGVAVEARDAGAEVAAWFTDLLGEPARLVGVLPQNWRPLPGDFDVWKQPMSFADACPVLVAGTASLEWLQQRATEPFGMERFRPNLIVDTDHAWAEDTWRAFRVGGAELVQHLPWPRCAVPQIDQDPQGLDPIRGSEPAKVLRQHRWCAAAPTVPEKFRRIVEGNGLFGVGCTIGPVGHSLAVGDAIVVDSLQTPVLPMPA